MKQEDKELLLKDLYGRIPYGVKVSVGRDRMNDYLEPEGKQYLIPTLYYINPQRLECIFKECWWTAYIGAIRPYLRPISSMTEEEKDEVKEICADYLDEWENAETVVDRWKLDAKTSYLRSAFYNSHHLDWNGLIPMGLALEAPDEMYKKIDI